LGGSGSVNVANFDYMTLIDSFYNSSNYLTLLNTGEINAENWLVKTLLEDTELFITNEGNLTFNPSFIEDVSSPVIASIGPEGQEFVEDSGGTITVTNSGSFIGQSSTEASSLEYLLYIIVMVAAAIVVTVVFLVMRKKSSNASS
jgi:hypothetical protein